MRTRHLILTCALLAAVAAGWMAMTSEAAAAGAHGPGRTDAPLDAPPAAPAPAPVHASKLAQNLAGRPADEPRYRSPMHVCASADGQRAFVVCQGTDSVAVLDTAQRKVVAEIAVGAHPTAAVLSADERLLYVTCTHDYTVDVVDLEAKQVAKRLPVGFEPIGIASSPDGSRLCAVNALADSISIFDLATGERRDVAVGRRPRYVADNGDQLVVGNAESRDVSIVDPRTGRVVETRSLDRAAQLREVVCTDDGRYAVVATLVGHDEMITTQMDRGWINSNGIAVLDLRQRGHFVIVLLDRVLSGATNPWGLAISADQRRLYVTLAGIHQVAIVDLPALLALVETTTAEQVQRLSQDVEILEQRRIAVRVDAGGLGPRGVAVADARGELLVAHCFTDAVAVLDPTTGALLATIPIGPQPAMSLWREGELRFNDGRICFENWLSCASCHEENGTMDSLNWDLINDGMGNPKNAKSLHNGMFEPPAMWSGVRKDQDAGTMAGQRFLGFLPDQRVQAALMEFLGRPPRAPNPHRNADPELLRRGEQVFLRARCDVCHVPPAYTDLKMHDVGLRGFTSRVDFRARFDTPSLIDCYRTAPYLHDGRAPTLLSLFTEHNDGNGHGLTRGLSPIELDELVVFLRSL
ncbi:MAG: hypothetical protein FJ265_17270 [Planctomycetes bacterium]|nr:hypothetical protein [Planctomycetota bacterium]